MKPRPKIWDESLVLSIWDTYFRPIELFCSVAFVIAVAIWGFYFGGNVVIDQTLDGNRAQIYGSLASAFGAMFGFVIAALTIILGYVNSEKLSLLRASPGYNELWRTYSGTIRWLGYSFIVAIVALILDKDSQNGTGPNNWLAFYSVLFGISISTVRLIRSVWIIEQIVYNITKVENAPEETQHDCGDNDSQ